jgi:hypothetical protein
MATYQLDPAETVMLHELARNLDEIDAQFDIWDQ